MCGITGWVARAEEAWISETRLAEMMARLRHRGPDAQGSFAAPGVALGVQRLRIIDLETGDQPVSNEDGSVVVICNGEIYNHVELRAELEATGHRFRTRSDTEVLVHAYEEDGVDLFGRLRGMFAVALWDARAGRLVLARDRFGIKPLYYAETDQGLIFGSEQKAILAAGVVSREINLAALAQVFAMGYVVSPATLFASVRQLEPASVLVYRRGETAIHSYWDLRFPDRTAFDKEKSESRWAEELFDRLDEAVRLHLRSDVPVGAWLSGGLDSSSIVALMSRHVEGPIRVTALGFSDPRIDEFRAQSTLLDHPEFPLVARRPQCDAVDLARLPEVLWQFEDPTTSGIELPRFLLGEESARDGKVVLTGEGSDEVFGGYTWFRLDRFLRPLSRWPLALRKLLLLGPVLPDRFPRAAGMILSPPSMTPARYQQTIGIHRPGAVGALFSADVLAERGRHGEPPWDLALPADFGRWHPFCQLQYVEMKVRLASYIIPTLDRGAMAHSVEARVPFLDHELVEFAARIPPSIKMKGTREKHVLRLALGGTLPREIVDRPKRGFQAPLSSWMKGELPHFAREEFSESRLRQTGWFDARGVERLLVEHRQGAYDGSHELYGILSVQLWDRLFVRGESASSLQSR